MRCVLKYNRVLLIMPTEGIEEVGVQHSLVAQSIVASIFVRHDARDSRIREVLWSITLSNIADHSATVQSKTIGMCRAD